MAIIPIDVEIRLHTRECPDCRQGWSCRWLARLEAEQRGLAANTLTLAQIQDMDLEYSPEVR